MPFRKPMRAPVPPPPGRGCGRSVRALLALWAVAAVVFFAPPADRAMAQTGPTTPVDIPDANLRTLLEARLGKAAGATITRAEMAAFTGFPYGSPPRRRLRLDHVDWNSHLVPTPPVPATVVRELTGLEYLTAIQGFSIIHHRIMDLRPLAGLTGVRRLWLRGNLISDLSPLRGLPLDQLGISYNPVSDLRPLAGMVELANFHCDRCQISDISPLAGLTRLTFLDLNNNYIRSIEPLRRVNDLAEVYLSDNDIEDLSPLENRNLRTLTAAGNRITDLSPLRNSLAMETLDLNLNEGLRDVSVVERMVALKVLRLDGTDVRDLSPLVRNNGLGSGDQVYLRNLPNLNADAEQHVETLRGRGVYIVTNTPLRLDRTVRDVDVEPGVEKLTVSWTRMTPAPEFTPQGYRVYWWSGHQDRSSRYTPPQHHDATAETSSYTIPNLTPGTKYQVQMLPYPPWPGGEFSAIVAGTPYAALRVEGLGGGPAVTVTPGVESLAVSWHRVPGAGDYKVQWKSGDEGYDPDARQARTGGDKTSYTIRGLVPGTEYTVRIIATRADGVEGPPSDEATGTPDLGQVIVERVEPRWESLFVSWERDEHADGYKVQWKSGDEEYDEEECPLPTNTDARQACVPGEDTSHTIEGLVPDTKYTVRVIATKADAPDDGEASEENTVRLRSPDDLDVKEAPETLVISWNRVDGADNYKVQWKSGDEEYDEEECPLPTNTDARQACVPGADTSHTIEGLVPDTKYTVRVIAIGANGRDLEVSNDATGTPEPPEPPPSPLGRVEIVDVKAGVESLVVSWNPVTDADNYDADNYKVQWRKSDGEGYDPKNRQHRTDDADTTKYTIRDLEPDVEHTVRVIATRADGTESDPSEEKTGVPWRRVGVSVADAGAVEGSVVEFPLRLSEPSKAVVTLTWFTEAGGTAQAGADYRAVAAGRLEVQPGEAGGTLRVTTLDDGRVEPAETFRVRLKKAENAYVEPQAGSATGTITDDDTEAARRRALSLVLAGMGRTIAADAVDVVGERFAPQPAAAAQVAVGGLALTPAAFGTREPVSPMASGTRVAGGGPAPGAAAPWGAARHDGSGRAHAAGPSDVHGWRTWTPGEGFRPPSALELLSRSSFDLPLSPTDAAGAAHGGGFRLWGRGTAGGFSGTPEAGFRMDGEVFGAYVGLDHRADRDTVLGMAIAHTKGDADYEAEAVTTGAVELEMTSVLPYAHWKPRPDLGVWGLLGVGRGEVGLEDEAGRVETDVEMLTAAFGLRQEVATWRGIDVALEADTFLTGLETEATGGLPKSAGDARRLRLRLEGRKEWEISAHSRMTPSLDVGGRWDGGDAESGLGVEVGGGLAWVHTGLGLNVDARGRYLLAHGKSAFDERGGSLTVRLDPGRAGRGPWLAFAPGWGAQGSRIAQIWDGAGGLRSNRSAGGTRGWSPDRLALDAGYGLARGGAGLLTPYAGLSMTGPQARAYKVGTRLEVGDRLDLRVEGRRSVRADGDAGNEAMFYGHLRW